MRSYTYLAYRLICSLLTGILISACIRPATTPLSGTSNSTKSLPPAINFTIQPTNPSVPSVELINPIITPEGVAEYAVREIILTGPASTSDAEISGLAWYQEYLLLLPQYPSRFMSEGDGSIFAIHKQDILNYLQYENTPALEPLTIPVYTAGLEKRISGFEGFEAISIYENQIFLTIEARPKEMLGYLASGWIAPDLSAITLDTNLFTPLTPPTDLPNSSFEALTTFGRRIVVLFEANGAAVNPNPTGLLIGLDLTIQNELSFPHIEYRITDATSTNSTGQFWAINYFYPGDTYLETIIDPIVDEYGEGNSHLNQPQIERLIAFQFTEQGIVLGNADPIQLELAADGTPRNWEGIASLDDIGFLVVTDKHPHTILGYVAYP